MTDPFSAPSDRDPGDFKRSKMGAPYVSDPDKPGKMRIYSRASGYMVDPSPFNLLKWKERQLAAGMMQLQYDWTVVDLDDRDALDGLINDAYDAADTDLAARRGTHVHLLCETVVNDEPYEHLIDVGELLGIPSALQHSIVKEFMIMRARVGVRMLEAELRIVNDIVQAAGTTDLLDIATRDIVTEIGTIQAGGAVIADIKTGGLDTDTSGHPKWWVKYGPQLVIYRDGQPYDTETDTRIDWPRTPHPDIAFIYHYDLKRALNGEPVEWLVIPVDLRVAREGVRAAQDIKAYAKRRDVFAAPVAAPDRKQALLDRYHALTKPDQETFKALGIDRDDLDAIEAAIAEREVDPFDRVTEPPTHEPTPDVPIIHEPSPPVDRTDIDYLLDVIHASEHNFIVNRWAQEARNDGVSFDPRHHPDQLHLERLRAAFALAVACDGDDDKARRYFTGNPDLPVGVLIADSTIVECQIIQSVIQGYQVTLTIAPDGSPSFTRTPTATTLFG